MTTTPCNAEWHDDLNPDASGAPIHCRRSERHSGPHYNPHAGITWGNPTNWFGDAA